MIRVFKNGTREMADLANYMSELSEQLHFAGWLIGIEFELWAWLTGAPIRGCRDVTEEDRAKLRRLHEACGGWVYWDDAGEFGGHETWVPTEVWKARVAGAIPASAS